MHWLGRANPNWTAVQASEETLSYGELFARASAGAESLRGAERVAIALEPGLDFAIALHACLLAGAAAVPLDLREPSPRLAGASLTIDAPPPPATRPRAGGATPAGAAPPPPGGLDRPPPAPPGDTSGTPRGPKPGEIPG